MVRIFTLIILLFFFNACKEEYKDKEYHPLLLKRIAVSGQGMGGGSDSTKYYIEGYEHYLSVENYNENKWSEFYIDYADKYIDTCKTDLPIVGITFCKPFDYKPYYEDLRDLDPLWDHAIISISYTYETLYKKFPDIWTIQIWDDGKSRMLYIRSSDRFHEDYYDSSGIHKMDFVKEIDKKFHTHFSDSTFPKSSIVDSISH